VLWDASPVGALVQVRARLEAPEPGARAAAVVKVRGDFVPAGEPDGVARGVEAIRSGLREACAGLPADARALLPGLVVGDTSGMPEDLAEAMKATGLAHLTAVSGANLTLLLVVLRSAAAFLGARGRMLTVVLVAGVVGFVVVCLAEPSVVRAAAMGLVGVAAVGRRGSGQHSARHLGTAILVVLLIDPWMARSVGFALSVLATAGILWKGRVWAGQLSQWAPRWVAESLSVTVAAQLATAPVLIALAGRISLVGVVTNLAAAPLVAPATVVGLLAALIAPWWPPVAVLLVWPAGFCAAAIGRIARSAALLPGAAFGWSGSVVGVLLAGAAAVVLFRVMGAVFARAWLAAAVATLLVVAVVRGPVWPGWPPGNWAVTICDVGQGDAVVLNAGDGAAVLVDAGPDPEALRACLRHLRVARVPLVILTHLHADHVTGVEALEGFGVEQVVTSSVRTPASGDAMVVSLGSDRHRAETGDAWRVGQAVATVLAAPTLAGGAGEDEGESSAENDASLLIRAQVDDVAVLIAGDAEVAGQRAHARVGSDIDVDVLLVPHHGSSRHFPGFLQASAPDLAVISVGAGNDYGHPSPTTLGSLRLTGATVVRTDESGSVAVGRDPGSGRLAMTTQR
ncbi:MAG: ComEC/Rec2 family competence protein, partial [Propioniciclava sp.]